MWMNQNFLLSEDIIVQVPLLVRFMSLREGGRLVFKVEQSGQVSRAFVQCMCCMKPQIVKPYNCII